MKISRKTGRAILRYQCCCDYAEIDYDNSVGRQNKLSKKIYQIFSSHRFKRIYTTIFSKYKLLQNSIQFSFCILRSNIKSHSGRKVTHNCTN